MVFDLRAALLKKGEVESARLMDFEFRLRARTWRWVAEALDAELDTDDVAKLIAQMTDDALAAHFALLYPGRAADLDQLRRDCAADARTALIAELGDPRPHRLL